MQCYVWKMETISFTHLILRSNEVPSMSLCGRIPHHVREYISRNIHTHANIKPELESVPVKPFCKSYFSAEKKKKNHESLIPEYDILDK